MEAGWLGESDQVLVRLGAAGPHPKGLLDIFGDANSFIESVMRAISNNGKY